MIFVIPNAEISLKNGGSWLWSPEEDDPMTIRTRVALASIALAVTGSATAPVTAALVRQPAGPRRRRSRAC
jgi:hypothetical protein